LINIAVSYTRALITVIVSVLAPLTVQEHYKNRAICLFREIEFPSRSLAVSRVMCHGSGNFWMVII